MVDEKLDLILSVVFDIKLKVDNLETRFDRLEVKVDNLETRFDRLETKVDNLETRFDRLETKVDNLEARFDRLEIRFDRLETKVDRLETKVDNLETRFDRLETKVDNLDSEFRSFKQQVSESFAYVNNRFTLLEKQMLAIGVELKAEIAREIQGVGVKVERLEKQVIYDRSETLEIKTSIRELDDRLTKVENHTGL